MADAPFVPVGRIVKVHGLNGEVSVAVAAGPPFVLREGMSVWAVPPAAQPRPYRIVRVRQGPKGPLVTLDGITDRHAAEPLRGRTLVADPADLPEGWDIEPEDEIGLRVVDAERGDIGVIEDVIVTGANDVWVVRGGAYGEVLVPVIDDVVTEIDSDTGIASVRLLPGLLPDEDDAR